MTTERQKAILDWCAEHCRTCVNNLDARTEFVNCQKELEVEKDVGIACVHYEEVYDIEPQESEVKNGS